MATKIKVIVEEAYRSKDIESRKNNFKKLIYRIIKKSEESK